MNYKLIKIHTNMSGEQVGPQYSLMLIMFATDSTEMTKHRKRGAAIFNTISFQIIWSLARREKTYTLNSQLLNWTKPVGQNSVEAVVAGKKSITISMPSGEV